MDIVVLKHNDKNEDKCLVKYGIINGSVKM